jgi:ankyrin repeat protein
MSPQSLPTRQLPAHPDLDQLKRQAKELLDAFLSGATDAQTEVLAHYHDADPKAFALHDAQLVLARSYGFDSWPKLKASVEGVTIRHLTDAVIAGDVEQVRVMLKARPELARGSADDLSPMHHAVLNRSLEMVRLLMQNGASAHHGLYPHRDATSPLTLAAERGYDEIVKVIRELERRQETPADAAVANPIGGSAGPLETAVVQNRADMLKQLLESGVHPDERVRLEFGDPDAQIFSSGMPLWRCAGSGKYEMAEMLLKHGADPNASVYASGDPIFQAYSEHDWKMVKLLVQHGGVPCATAAGLYRQTELARKMLAGEAPYRLERGGTLAEELLWGAACGGDPEIVRMALERVGWPRDDPRWFEMLEQPLRLWAHGSGSANWDRTTYFICFRLLLEGCDPNVRGRTAGYGGFGLTILHGIAGARRHLTADDRLAFATTALDAGARLDLRDHVLKSTALGWACRWGRIELVRLFLDRGADSVEPDAEPWATPEAWAGKKGHADVLAMLHAHRAGGPSPL